MTSPSCSSSVQVSTTCSTSSITLTPTVQTTPTNNEVIITMDFLCEEQNKNRRFSFPKQKVVLENDQTVINLKKTFELSDALKIVLLDSVLFRFDGSQTQVFIGMYDQQVHNETESQLLIDIDEETRNQNRVHLSFYRKKDDTPVQTFTSSQDNTLNRKRKLEEIVSNSSQITFVSLDNISQLSLKDSNPSLNSTQILPGLTHSQSANLGDSSRKKKKLNTSGNYIAIHQDQDGLTHISQNNNSQDIKGDFDDASSDQKDYSSNKSSRKEDEKANQKKSQERTIKEALEMVSQWRDLQDFYKSNNITKDYQSVADEIGISKKTLDYYYLELRTAEYFGFNFDFNLDKKMGILREFIQESKKNYQNQFSTHKIPRHSQLKYRIPKQQDLQINQQQQNEGHHLNNLTSMSNQQQMSSNYSNNNTAAMMNPNGQQQNYNSNVSMHPQNTPSNLNQKCFYDQQIILPTHTIPQQQHQYKENQHHGSSNLPSANTLVNQNIMNQNAPNCNNLHSLNHTNSGMNNFSTSNCYNDHQYNTPQMQHQPISQQQQPQQFLQNADIYQTLFTSSQNDFNQQRFSFQLQEQNMDYSQPPVQHNQSSSQSTGFPEQLIQFGNNGNSCGNSNNLNNNSNNQSNMNNNRMHSCQQILPSFI